MILRLQSNKAKIDLDDSKRRSDEPSGRTYEIAGDPPRIAKVLPPYPPSSAQDEVSQKLSALLLLRDAMWKTEHDRPYLLWPKDLLIDDDGRPRGYVTERLPPGALEPDIRRLYDIEIRRTERHALDYRTLVRVALNVSRIVAAIHRNGFSAASQGEHRAILVNLTERRLRVFVDDGFVSLADLDLIQVANIQTNTRFHAAEPSPEYVGPDAASVLQGHAFFDVTTDHFSLGITLFKLLMELAHPFTGLVENDAAVPAEAIKKGSSPYFGKNVGAADPDQLGLGDLASDLEAMFRDCLSPDDGFGLYEPSKRPTAARWVAALETALDAMKECEKNPRHWYFDGGPDTCPWCRLRERTGIDRFPPLALPFVTSIAPKVLPLGGGDIVIGGEHLSSLISVSFGDKVVRRWRRATSTEIELEAPAGKGEVEVVVETEAGRSNAYTVKYKAPPLPKISSVTPALINAQGGRVTIEGSHFDGGDDGASTKVIFGQHSVPIVSREDSRIVVTAPPGQGTIEVTVETSDGRSAPANVTYEKASFPWAKVVAGILLFVGVVVLVRACIRQDDDKGGGAPSDASPPPADARPILPTDDCPKLPAACPSPSSADYTKLGKDSAGRDIWWCPNIGPSPSVESKWICGDACLMRMEYCYLKKFHAACSKGDVASRDVCAKASTNAWRKTRRDLAEEADRDSPQRRKALVGALQTVLNDLD